MAADPRAAGLAGYQNCAPHRTIGWPQAVLRWRVLPAMSCARCAAPLHRSASAPVSTYRHHRCTAARLGYRRHPPAFRNASDHLDPQRQSVLRRRIEQGFQSPWVASARSEAKGARTRDRVGLLARKMACNSSRVGINTSRSADCDSHWPAGCSAVSSITHDAELRKVHALAALHPFPALRVVETWLAACRPPGDRENRYQDANDFQRFLPRSNGDQP